MKRTIMDTKKSLILLKILIIVLISIRFLSLPFDVLKDSTEARYAEIGRKMFLSENYVTPFIEDNVPFWAKPPLSFWATAFSYAAFGVNQFAAHLSPFLFLLLAVFLAYFFVREHFDDLTAHVTLVILTGFGVFLYLMGGTMTDPALAFTLTLSFVAFWNALYGKKHALLWGYLFFIGLGLSLLAKGPIGPVLAGLSAGIWVLFKNKWKKVWQKLPLFSGLLLMLAVALPWYLLAESRTPGFLQYFIIGEHFERYLTPGWQGDLYGEGRGGFRGIIWFYYLVSLMPWIFYFLFGLFSKNFRKDCKKIALFGDEKLFYIFMWIFAPLLFFSFSRNTLLAYVLPTSIPSAILMAHFMCKDKKHLGLGKFLGFSLVNILFFSFLILVALFFPQIESRFIKSDKILVEKYQKTRLKPETPLLYLASKRHSSDFYSGGQAKKMDTFEALSPHLDKNGEAFVVIRKNTLETDKRWQDLQIEVLEKNSDRALLKIEAKPGDQKEAGRKIQSQGAS